MNTYLNDDEKKILFEGGTEAAFSSELLEEKRAGDFVCKNCGVVLFTSQTKFDSGSGWPSFSEPADREHVVLEEDYSLGMVRTEVKCKNCGAHLGHVFPDGPQDMGGDRYCVNGACLVFRPKEEV